MEQTNIGTAAVSIHCAVIQQPQKHEPKKDALTTAISSVFGFYPIVRCPSCLRRLGQVIFYVVAFLLTFWSGRVYATVLGSPAPQIFDGELGLGARGSDYRETLFLDYGVSDDATLQFLAGRVTFPGMRGTEFGAGLRYKIGPAFFADSAPTRLGVFGFYRAGSENGDIGDMDFTLLDAGFGVSIMPGRHVLLFASAIYRYMEIDIKFDERDENYETGSDLGASFGAELWFTTSFVVGLEIHTGLKDDNLAGYIEFKL